MADKPPLRAKFEDLTPSEVTLCDPFLFLLTKYNRTDPKPLDGEQKAFWAKVFTYWNTNDPPIKPALPRRTASDSSIEVGTLKEDCPVPSQGTKRKQDGTYVLPASRRRGAPVLLKLGVDTEGQQLTFKFTDKGNSMVSASLVQLRPGYTHPRARATLVVHWDRNEEERVSRYNEQLTVFWARKQLVERLQVMVDGNSAGWAETPDKSELVMLTSAADILEVEAQTAQIVRNLGKGNPHVRDNMVVRTP